MVKWQGRQGSSNIEDRRGQGGGSGGGLGGGLGGGGLGSNPFGQGGGGFRLPSGRSGGGMGGIAIIVIFIIIALAFGINPLSILTGDTTNSSFTNSQSMPPSNASQDELANFVGVMVKDTEDYWGKYFAQQGDTYTPPKVVLFSQRTQSACGTADTASGPFYCPDDRKVYIDLAFYDQLRRQFGAPGDFAQAYVIAHEVGHHVQNLIGVLPEFNRKRQTMSQDQANAYSVRVELQADCFAGAWGKGEFEQGYLDSGDVEEAINAANQIGDDTLTRGTISPRQYTHGTSAQRMKWFKQGYTTGDPAQCDTINGGI